MKTISPGIHHITAVASSAPENLVFYEQVLGLRLVKRTVNFDDPFTYHLYYGDAFGTPGTLLTFFPWERLPRGRAGAGTVTAVGFAVPSDALGFWGRRLSDHGIPTEPGERFGDPVLRLEDPHGLAIELVAAGIPIGARPWTEGPVPPDLAITGIDAVTATVTTLDRWRELLTSILGMTETGRERDRFRFGAGMPGGSGRWFDLLLDAGAAPGRPGAGTVHHIAFRASDDARQKRLAEDLKAAGFAVSPVKDRKYFRSIYFQAPEGILFEIATDAPGFSVDEPVETLGRALMLPEAYESMRPDIERRLPGLPAAG